MVTTTVVIAGGEDSGPPKWRVSAKPESGSGGDGNIIKKIGATLKKGDKRWRR